MPNFEKGLPLVDISKLPPEERGAGEQLKFLLFMLNYYVRCFEADVQLYEISAEQIFYANVALKKDRSDVSADDMLEIMDGWPIVAARDGALSIYHFGQTLDGVDIALGSGLN